MAHPAWPTVWIMFSVLMAWEDYRDTGGTARLQSISDFQSTRNHSMWWFSENIIPHQVLFFIHRCGSGN